MDPLADVLTLLETRSHVSHTLEVDGPSWRLRFQAPEGMKFNAVRAGEAWLTVPGGGHPVRVRAGDAYLLTRPTSFELAGDLEASPQPTSPVFAAASGGVARLCTSRPGPPGLVASGGAFTFRGPVERLTGALPDVLLVPAGSPGAASVHRTLDEIDEELRSDGPGAEVVAEHLAAVMLVRVLRWHLAHHPPTRGWLRGLADPVVGAALSAIHAEPARRWSLQTLADASHVSRSLLAQRFKQLVGSGPVEYLVDWRMEIAARRLARGEESVAAVGRSVGYDSESAFSTAFKRVRGTTPSQARRGAARATRESVSGSW